MSLRTLLIGLLLVAEIAVTTACGGRLLRLRVGPIGVNLLVDEEVEVELPSDQEVLTDNVIGTVLGKELRVDEGELFHGDLSYGLIEDGDTVEVLPTKLMVNDEFRGSID